MLKSTYLLLVASAAASTKVTKNKTPLILGHGESCSQDHDCRHEWFSKKCCETMGVSDACYVYCSYGDASQDKSTQSGDVMKGYEFGMSEKDSNCVATSFEADDITHIENQILSAFRYGNAQAIYSSYQSIVTVAGKFAAAEKKCESFWEKVWEETEVVVQDIVNVAQYICKYSAPVIEGTSAVGLEEAVPVETAIAGVACAAKYFDEALAVMKAIDDGVSCVELAFGVKQFVNYFDQQDQFNYEIGKFSGEVYRYGKSCVAFPKDVMAAVSGGEALMSSTEPLASQKRQLKENASNYSNQKLGQEDPSNYSPSKLGREDPSNYSPSKLGTAPPALSNVSQCQYCLSEAEFVQFFQGIYDGQAYIDRSLPKMYVQECIDHTTPEIKSLFTGQLQSKLTGLQLAYEFRNMDDTLKMMYELDELTYSVLSGSSKCQDMAALAVLHLIKGKEPILTKDSGKDVSVFFNSTEGVTIELASVPQMISFNNKKLTDAQATNSTTADKSKYLYNMGEQLGLATKLYAKKGSDAAVTFTPETSDWQNTVFIALSVGILFSVIAVCVVTKNKRQNKNQLTVDIEEKIEPVMQHSINSEQ